ncbi:hypothetical protein RINTHM_350 [Richelia intracellularis HM01]|jgi:hypothetical protein|uniref:Uncharacterized protein n=1 Tax=Richelia intracellularis HH01 TaxID=1165094 RepID=M1WYB4_9NOST|nr:hypothetical protein RINTHM_350 [Richelia intracellularis HM01]CCH66757.1 hypothetical protein RINTHH_6020 [Richelia intracellularis HH01]
MIDDFCSTKQILFCQVEFEKTTYMSGLTEVAAVQLLASG